MCWKEINVIASNRDRRWPAHNDQILLGTLVCVVPFMLFIFVLHIYGFVTAVNSRIKPNWLWHWVFIVLLFFFFFSFDIKNNNNNILRRRGNTNKKTAESDNIITFLRSKFSHRLKRFNVADIFSALHRFILYQKQTLVAIEHRVFSFFERSFFYFYLKLKLVYNRCEYSRFVELWFHWIKKKARIKVLHWNSEV